jgi:alpha-beta hydrolase superfamily lysophospholipase
MKAQAMRRLKQLIVLVLVSLLTLLVVRACDSQRGPPLELWHTYAPSELTGRQLQQADWQAYLAAEQVLFDEVRERVTRRLAPAAQVPANRYFDGSPLYPGRFTTDWNRSFILEPDGEPVGAAVFLHGLTDSPYSARHLAELYRDHGFVAVAIRLPGHGTVPGGLARIHWKDWSEATRLAVREARRRVDPQAPLHIVGYSNGGALAMKYALDALEDPRLARPDQVVLISPMIGVTSFARFAGVFGWPAVIPRFAKAAWLNITPEFNPFKYNSFPVNGARQSSVMTRTLQPRLQRYARDQRLGELPPILTFQSVVDFTVSTPAIISALYARLPDKGHELVLFDVNRNAVYGPLLRADATPLPESLLPAAPRGFRSAVIANATPATRRMVERATAAGASLEQERALALSYPPGVFSLSHIALPFPVSDSLYGLQPDLVNEFGVSLGALAPRGERGTLIVSVDALTRLSSNPFFPYMLERIEETIRRGAGVGPDSRSEVGAHREPAEHQVDRLVEGGAEIVHGALGETLAGDAFPDQHVLPPVDHVDAQPAF